MVIRGSIDSEGNPIPKERVVINDEEDFLENSSNISMKALSDIPASKDVISTENENRLNSFSPRSNANIKLSVSFSRLIVNR